jgi:hypothetical protein
MPAAKFPARAARCRAASAASFRITDIRMIIDDEPSPQAFQRYPPRAHGGLCETGPRHLREPSQELVSRHVVHPFGDWRGDAIEHQRFSFSHPAIFCTAIKSFMLRPFNGH